MVLLLPQTVIERHYCTCLRWLLQHKIRNILIFQNFFIVCFPSLRIIWGSFEGRNIKMPLGKIVSSLGAKVLLFQGTATEPCQRSHFYQHTEDQSSGVRPCSLPCNLSLHFDLKKSSIMVVGFSQGDCQRRKWFSDLLSCSPEFCCL